MLRTWAYTMHIPKIECIGVILRAGMVNMWFRANWVTVTLNVGQGQIPENMDNYI